MMQRSAQALSESTLTPRLFATAWQMFAHVPPMKADTCWRLASLIFPSVNISVALLYEPTFTTWNLTPNLASMSL